MEVERRRMPRARIAVSCTLRRRSGSPITGRTYDLGPGGMSVSTVRPLAADELLSFDLELDGEPRVDGHARVLRQQHWDRYSLRFESLSEQKRARLAGLAGSPV
jgi:c-di-GMP-binding flagellar brake protein YcgR